MDKEIIGIIGAMPQEVNAIRAYLENETEIEIKGIRFYQGKIHSKQVVVCLSGVGKVSAAISTTVLCMAFEVTQIINIGTAGGLRQQQNTLDVVISTKVTQHDFDTSFIDGESGKGKSFDADQALAKKIQLIFQKKSKQYAYDLGEIVSGDQFIAETEKIEKIMKQFPNAIACEMEAAAIGQVCQQFNVPFIVIRSLSDIVYHDNSHIDFMKNVLITSERSASVVAEFLNE